MISPMLISLPAAPDQFLRRCQYVGSSEAVDRLVLTICHVRDRYGPIYSIKLAGKKFVYITTEASISWIYKKPASFVFSPIR
jgi:hypothetical protein